MTFAIAVKAIIVHEGKLLLIKRRLDDVHKPGAWEIPGGRLEEGEDPFRGLQRESEEEAGISIRIEHPLRVHHFTRDDGQRITMIVFLCTSSSQRIRLSEEHVDHAWLTIEEAKERIVPDFREDLERYERYFQKHF